MLSLHYPGVIVMLDNRVEHLASLVGAMFELNSAFGGMNGWNDSPIPSTERNVTIVGNNGSGAQKRENCLQESWKK
ncbi:hypothetical protein TNCT_308761 [Trichonephila clavata]|uniref:Uncharacterized protein n=1 Tax=Trichonephila clavata TaxID=2740835 RepID=A0A8X6G411_TRICU|nr:hypothetical protein TNCT_308761 [Trichonephila clavata]